MAISFYSVINWSSCDHGHPTGPIHEVDDGLGLQGCSGCGTGQHMWNKSRRYPVFKLFWWSKWIDLLSLRGSLLEGQAVLECWLGGKTEE